MRIKPEHVPRTAFQNKLGSYQFRVMPFGLCNAPGTFQRTLNNVLAECRAFADVYIEDIVIHSHTLTEHLTHLRLVLDILSTKRLFAKLKK